ncbi:MAG: hypothetical protein H7Y09_11025 [Chitinophagaceae bacterium]|nr:hypothetical protein [Anaerolineae bacterium]
MNGEIVIAVFPSRSLLTDALDHIAHVRDVTIKRAAIVAKAANGEMVVLDDDISSDEGGIAGAMLGAAVTVLGLIQLGAFTLPGVGTIIALAAGILIGGLLGGVIGHFAANLLDFRLKIAFKNIQILNLAERLQTGKPALVLEIVRDSAMLNRLRQELNLFQAEFVQRGDDDMLHNVVTG